MAIARIIRAAGRLTPILKKAGLTVLALFGGLLLLGRAAGNSDSDGSSLDLFIACGLFAVAAFFGLRVVWMSLRLWAETRPPSLPANDHPYGPPNPFERATDAARRMRGD